MSNDTKRVWAYTRVDWELIRDDNSTAVDMLPTTVHPSREAAQRAAEKEWKAEHFEGCGCMFEPLKWGEPTEFGQVRAVIAFEDPEDLPEEAIDSYLVYPIEVAE